MATNMFKLTNMCALVACLFLASCGGSGGESSSSSVPLNYNVELFTGKTTVDLSSCIQKNGDIVSANYTNLSKIAIYKDSFELLETYEKCRESGVANIAIIKNNNVNRLELFWSHDIGGLFPIDTEHPSGFYRVTENDYFIIGFTAASSDKNFELDAAIVAENNRSGFWTGYMPGLFRYPVRDYNYILAGSNAFPQVVDGQGRDARFYAPHDLEVDAKQLMYTVDNGMVRTIDRSYQVKTLPNADLGVQGAVKAIDADRAGAIHVLGRQPDGGYIWVRMADKSKLAFKLPASEGGTTLQTIETFTVVGDSLVIARRNYEANTSELFRVSATGAVEELTGSGRIAWPSTGATSGTTGTTGTAAARFLKVQHVEYGVDGHLYIVLPQGVLRIKDFK